MDFKYRWYATMEAPEEVIAVFREQSEDARCKLAADGSSGESEGSWYDLEDELGILSKTFPDVAICLSGGEGGEVTPMTKTQSQWDRFFKKKKHDTASWEKFSEQDLKDIHQFLAIKNVRLWHFYL